MRDDAVAARDADSRNDIGEMNDRRASPTDFERLAERAISRRGFLCGTAICGASAFVMAAGGMAVRASVTGLDLHAGRRQWPGHDHGAGRLQLARGRPLG